MSTQPSEGAVRAARYLGEVDPNAILRGEVAAHAGDTFTTSAVDQKGFYAFIFTPQTPEPAMAYQHFKLLERGLRRDCEVAAETALSRHISTQGKERAP